MIVGTRVVYPEEVGLWKAELLQISVYSGMSNNLEMMRQCAGACREAGIRYVVHPVGFFLLQKEMHDSLRQMAECADLALILHDEKADGDKRVEGPYEAGFRSVIEEIGSITNISFENAADTPDVFWFWNNYAGSITLDIGHVESSGLDSVEFVKSLDKNVIKKIQFVHMHRNNGLHGGLTDHWPITPECREVRALREIIKTKPDVSVILEINEIEMLDENLQFLRSLRNELI